MINKLYCSWAGSFGAAILAILPFAAPPALAQTATDGVLNMQAHREEPMPSGFHVENSELEGPVFADVDGHTLYIWPQKKLRNGYSGEAKGRVACYDIVRKETAGLMSPYPPGVLLPDLETRPSCTDLWPPVLAAEDAKEVGKWTILTGEDGRKQWAYDEQALYTSVLDQQPGDTYGGTKRGSAGDAPATREPIGPPARLPPGFQVKVTLRGLMLLTDESYSVYAFADDQADKLACTEQCVEIWKPLLAPAMAGSDGEWSVIERAQGVRQWVFRGMPLYTYSLDSDTSSLEGGDVPGWHNVYTQKAPPAPTSFTVQTSIAGDVLAGPDGKTIYIYHCGDDSIDQLSCEHPTDTQLYRIAMCGAGDPGKCQQHWSYLVADEGAKSGSRSWTILRIDPETGHFAEPEDEHALRVWAYRDRPVYTYYLDEKPGDVNGDGIGEWRGQRNGLKAFWLRNAFFGR